jgi:8-oxo-dGTP pyrophosphatase MutT (NUDIX family)
MKHAVACYIPKLDKSGLVLAVLNPKHAAWMLPGGKVEHQEQLVYAAARELHEETGLVMHDSLHVYAAMSPDDYMVHIFQATATGVPVTREPGHAVAWVTEHQICESKSFGEFFRKFFASRNWKPGGLK